MKSAISAIITFASTKSSSCRAGHNTIRQMTCTAPRDGATHRLVGDTWSCYKIRPLWGMACLVEVLSTLGILCCALGEDANSHLKDPQMSACGTRLICSCNIPSLRSSEWPTSMPTLTKKPGSASSRSLKPLQGINKTSNSRTYCCRDVVCACSLQAPGGRVRCTSVLQGSSRRPHQRSPKLHERGQQAL